MRNSPNAFSLLVLFIFGSILHLHATEISPAIRNQLVTLDSLIACYHELALAKEARISQMKKMKPHFRNTKEIYDSNEQLFNEYRAFKTDSALAYAERNLMLAQKMNDYERQVKSHINMAYAYAVIGQLYEALAELKKINLIGLSDEIKTEYYGQMYYLYARFAEYADNGDTMREFYYQKEFEYADSTLAVMPSDNSYYLLYQGWKDLRQANYTSAIHNLESYFKTFQPDNFTNAQMLYLLAYLYRNNNDGEQYLKYLVKTAIMDVRISNSDNISFRDLARELFKQGYIERAYNYVTFGIELALQSNNRVRMVSMISDLNKIQRSNVKLQKEQNHKLFCTLCIIGGMAVLLVIALVYIANQMRRISRQKQELATVNGKLNDANTLLSKHVSELTQMHLTVNEAKLQLEQLNERLSTANAALQEQNTIKEEYIGFVLLLCSDYISKLDGYRKNINRKVKAKLYDDLKNYTDSPLLIQSELKEFYSSFDAIFLHVFPNFVNDFNSLLLLDQRFILKEANKLNTELRIFALMHLGITDSGKIADFLHCSLQTVYNSRLRTRTKAISRDAFDANVRNLGK